MSTTAAPAVAGVGDGVYFFARRATDGRVVYNRATLGQGGVGWKEMEDDGRTDAAPAAGAVGTHVFVVIKGLDGNVYLTQADLAQPFGQWFLSDFHTDASPAVVGVETTSFFAKHPDGRIFYNRAPLGQGGVGWREMEGDGRTDAAPAAGAVGTHVFVVIKGLDGNVFIQVGWFRFNFPAVVGVGDNIIRSRTHF